MKKLLLITFILISGVCFSQTTSNTDSTRMAEFNKTVDSITLSTSVREFVNWLYNNWKTTQAIKDEFNNGYSQFIY